jgi:hypothetical protein
MRCFYFVLFLLFSFSSIARFAWSQERPLAPEARGLLPEEQSVGPVPFVTPNAFVADPASGGTSRIVFQSDANPDFNIVIRDFSFPPDDQSHALSLPLGGLLEIISGQGDIAIGDNRTTLDAAIRVETPRGAPVSVVNTGHQPVVVRALILEAK